MAGQTPLSARRVIRIGLGVLLVAGALAIATGMLAKRRFESRCRALFWPGEFLGAVDLIVDEKPDAVEGLLDP